MLSLGDIFTSPASAPPVQERSSRAERDGKRAAPFSIRLTEADRARLALETAGAPLGSYIKAKLLRDAPPARKRQSGQTIEDRQALAKALALLGSSRLCGNLSELAQLASAGALPFSPEIEAELTQALADIRAIRSLLMTALGLKPEGRP